MAFSETLARRTRVVLARRKNVEEKRMFGGVGFLLNGHLLVAVRTDPLLVRLGPEEGERALSEPHVAAFQITGRGTMAGWVVVGLEGVEGDDGSKDWIRRPVKFVGTLPTKRKGEEAMKATIRTPAEGRSIAVVGDVYRFLATGEDTNGKYAMWEAIVPPGGGPPPHVHSREEEGFYVLEGEITLQVGEKRILVTAGMFANMPVGTPHSFKNETDRPAKMLISVAPAGLEQMFFEVGVPLAQGATTAAPPTRDEIERMMAVAPKYGIEIRLPGH